MRYPTVAEVAQASLEELGTWHKHLPPPQTDVERAVRRRIHLRIAETIRQEAPQVADALDNLVKDIGDLLKGLKRKG